MEAIESVSCIKFVPRNPKKHPNYIEIVKIDGCWSYVGCLGTGRQELSIGSGCENVGIIVHELMHALGFGHMHSNGNRDEYIRINWDNIKPKALSNFEILDEYQFDTVTFDYSSIMLYGPRTFSKDGYLVTIESKLGGKLKDPWDKTLSNNDIYHLNEAYKCPMGNLKLKNTLDTIFND